MPTINTPLEPSDLLLWLIRGLERVLPNWRDELEGLGQLALIRSRLQGWRPKDDQAVVALLLSYLSAMTDWRRIQAARGEILSLLPDWEPGRLADLSEEELDQLHRAFLARRLGSVLLRRQLRWLRASAAVFKRMTAAAGSVDGWLRQQTQEQRVDMLAEPQSPWKLPGVGVPLAAEFLKNLGYDDFKPDRHLARILGPQRLSLSAEGDLRSIRRLGLHLAGVLHVPAAELDQLLWLYCARGYANVCGAKPRCDACPLSFACKFPYATSPSRLSARTRQTDGPRRRRPRS